MWISAQDGDLYNSATAKAIHADIADGRGSICMSFDDEAVILGNYQTEEGVNRAYSDLQNAIANGKLIHRMRRYE